MAAQGPSYSLIGVSPEELPSERACFYGTLLATLAYGALLMLYIQLAQVLLARPKRGQTFWAVVTYSGALFSLVTLAIGVRLKFTELSYIDHRDYPGGPSAYYHASSSNYINVMGFVSTTLFPWFADVLMLSRLIVIWNYQWWIAGFPALIYLSRLAISVPLLLSQTRPQSAWASRSAAFGTCYYALAMAFNLYITIMICARLLSMRKSLEVVTGKLHASFYTSSCTLFVESGGFFTVWITIYVIMKAQGSFIQDIFLLPCIFTQGIARMLIILRIAQDRAWSKDLVTATTRGVLDWQVSSTHSVPLHDDPSGSLTLSNRTIPRKLQEDSIIDMSTGKK